MRFYIHFSVLVFILKIFQIFEITKRFEGAAAAVAVIDVVVAAVMLVSFRLYFLCSGFPMTLNTCFDKRFHIHFKCSVDGMNHLRTISKSKEILRYSQPLHSETPEYVKRKK